LAVPLFWWALRRTDPTDRSDQTDRTGSTAAGRAGQGVATRGIPATAPAAAVSSTAS